MNTLRSLFSFSSDNNYARVEKDRRYYVGDQPPQYCQRCEMFYTEIRARDKKTNSCEYMCKLCLKKDKTLNTLPVKKLGE